MTVLVVVDRIQENAATLLTQEEEPWIISWPVRLLPPDIKEGDVLRICFEQDHEATRAAREEAIALLRKLSGE